MILGPKLKTLSILTFLAFSLVVATSAYAQFSLPYRVDASKADGVNIRSGPGSRFATIGVVNVGETVIILETDPGEYWGRITWNGQPAWVYLRLMEPAIPGGAASTPAKPTQSETTSTTPPLDEVDTVTPVDGLTAAEAAAAAAAEAEAAAVDASPKVSGISCEGTEPAWSARITGSRDFVFVEGSEVAQHRIIENAGTSVNSPNVQMFTALDYIGVLRGGQCNNGLSGKNYNLVIDLILNNGDSAKMYSGCCSIAGN